MIFLVCKHLNDISRVYTRARSSSHCARKERSDSSVGYKRLCWRSRFYEDSSILAASNDFPWWLRGLLMISIVCI
jgi:hypothetical protein